LKQNDLLNFRHSRAGGNPAETNILRSRQSGKVVPLRGGFFNYLDSRLRGNDEVMSKQLIYGLLLSVLMVTAPHADHLPLWVSALCATLLAWRAYLTYSGNPLPKRWLLLAITFACMGGILVGYGKDARSGGMPPIHPDNHRSSIDGL